MKKMNLLLVMLFIVSCVVVGCGKKEEVKQTSQSKQEQKQETKKDEPNKELGQLFKISDIKNKSQEEVNKILGQPTANRQEKWHYYDTKEEAPNCFANIYQKNNFEIEVFFIDGRSARITVTPKETIQSNYIEDVLKMFYLEFTMPTVANDSGSRWKNKFNVYEFDVNYQDKKVAFVYIILDEKYR